MAHAARFGVAGAHQQLVRPRLEAGWVSELRQAPPDPQQGLLRGVLGQLAVAEDALRNGLQPPSVHDDKPGERLLIPSLCRHHELGIHPSPHGAPVEPGVTSL